MTPDAPGSARLRVVVNAIPMVNVSTGIGRYIRSLYTALEQEHGDELEIGYFDGHCARATIPAPSGDISGWARMVKLLWKLPPAVACGVRVFMHLRRERRFSRLAGGFDVYHETSFFPFAASPALPVVFTIHDLSLLLHGDWHPRERVLFHRLFFRRRQRNVRHYLSVSEFTKSEMLAHLPLTSAQVTVTHLAYAGEVFHEQPAAELARVRQKHGLPERFFLFVGSGDPRKNAAIIPRALATSGLDLPLVSVGWSGWAAGDENSRLLRPLGYVNDADLAGIYGNALALVYPSVYEGFGLPVLEAMACGCPVVTTRCASLPEVAGEAALFMDDPTSATGLADLLVRLAADTELRARHRQLGLERVKHFSWSTTAKKTLNVFRALAPGNAAA